MDIIALILTFGAINGIVVGSVLLNLKNANPLATRVFALIIILFALHIGTELADHLGWDIQYPGIIGMSDTFVLLISPLLYQYALLITDRKTRFSYRDLLHILPFVSLNVYLLPFYLLPDAEKVLNPNYDSSGVIFVLKGVVVSFYFISSLLHILRYSGPQMHEKFPANNFWNIVWFKRLLIALILVAGSSLILNILFQMEILFQPDPDTIIVILLSIVFYANSFALIRNPFILWGTSDFKRFTVNISQVQEPGTKSRYRTSPLTDSSLRQNMSLLISAMEQSKSYLNPELDLLDLEEITGIKAYYISQTLSEVLNQNFYQFVNAYRVEHSKILIVDPSNNYKTILALGLESGFNSKSSFNRSFKNLTGMTPSRYKVKETKKQASQ